MGFPKIIAAIFTILSSANAAKLLGYENHKDVIPNSYIVVMKETVPDFDAHLTWALNVHHHSLAKRGSTTVGGLKHVYRINGWNGYSGSFDDDTLKEILDNEDVDYVERDRQVHIQGFVTQSNASSWGLRRISHRERGSRDFVYDDKAGEGITMYGVDSGIDIHHPDFGGRAVWGFNFVGGFNADGVGHGTHTAGTMAGTIHGVAKKAKIVAVKVLNNEGDGALSGIIGGINWSANHARRTGALGKAVMNLSIGGGWMKSFNQAVTNAHNAGIFVAVAAGNENLDAARGSPASAPGACAIAASTELDARASFSNWGSIVDLYAPGHNIISTLLNGTTGRMGGTSMAAPHVAGVGAAVMAAEDIAPSAVCAYLVQMAHGRIRNSGKDTTNKLLYNGSGL